MLFHFHIIFEYLKMCNVIDITRNTFTICICIRDLIRLSRTINPGVQSLFKKNNECTTFHVFSRFEYE